MHLLLLLLHLQSLLSTNDLNIDSLLITFIIKIVVYLYYLFLLQL
ncbi:hypothetical protein RMAECT_1409 [Rickettsia rhipicephali str. Ect]|uniref:Uncharacterized protein n=1 Tax=Rickettsia rhipicephali str. Ect TaxID=1359199 RepID=A0A0F3PHT0_RICRH|nr:hypothetical protein RMAECT_1409 [Rickettsia rhipicephali str. Ect]